MIKGYIRIENDGKKILGQRPLTTHPDDWYLTVVLAEWNDEYVTWLCNSEGTPFYAEGKYFKNYKDAFEHFMTKE